MLIDEIKARMTRAMRERDEVVRNILGLAVGEIQTAEARANRALGDDEAIAVVRKLLKSNEETLALDGGRRRARPGAAARDRGARVALAEVDVGRADRRGALDRSPTRSAPPRATARRWASR